jgi:hypothetical protein
MRRLLAAVGLAGLASIALLATAAPAGAASASNGCSGNATSFDSSGKQLSKVAAPGAGGTKDDPFEIKTDGKVDYHHQLKPAVDNGGSWNVKLLGVIKFGGDFDHSSSPGDGSEGLKSHFQFGGFAPLVGLIKADVVVEDKAGNEVCTFSGWIKIGDSVFKSPVFYAGIVFVGLGGLLGFGAMGRPA